MLLVDTSLLSDYLVGRPEARAFLDDRTDEPWAVSSLVLYEASTGALRGFIDGEPDAVRSTVSSIADVLDVTARTAAEASALQRELHERGSPAGTADALIAATAREHGAPLATADEFFWAESVQEVVPVAEYDPDRGGASA